MTRVFPGYIDLIDTLWNVKPVPYAVYYEDDTGFNRYIVECKVINGNGATTASGDLIDTLWNVKEDQSFKN